VRGEIYAGASQFDSYKADLFIHGMRLPDGAATTDWTTSVI
jgi:iron complex outermembrane receptor protein